MCVYGSYFCIYSANLCLLVWAFNPFTFKEIINMYALNAILLVVRFISKNFFFFLSSFVLFSCDLMSIFTVVFGLLFLFCVFTFCRYFVCVISLRFWYTSLHMHKIVLSCWSLTCQYSSFVLSSFLDLWFNIRFVYEWFPAFCLPLRWAFPFCTFSDSHCPPFIFCLKKFL